MLVYFGFNIGIIEYISRLHFGQNICLNCFKIPKSFIIRKLNDMINLMKTAITLQYPFSSFNFYF